MPRRAAATSMSGAPQVAQNLIPGSTGEAQRGQFGPEPGAVSRRPQWGQNGRSLLAEPLQKGQAIGSWSRAGPARATTRVLGNGAAPFAVSTPPPPPRPPPLPLPPPPPSPADAPAALRAVGLVMGLPQSMQNCAPGSFARPQ